MSDAPEQAQDKADDQIQAATYHLLVMIREFDERGAFLKRFQARAKGRGNRVLKHSCHIYLTVGD